MDRRERYIDQEELLRLAFAGMQARLWTALPGIIDRFDAAHMTVDVQPAINGRARDPYGVVSSLQMPKLLDCPVLWQGGGGVTLTFPIAAGDECLVVFASRCIDPWWSQGGVQDATDIRMHNLSDGFALVGVRSLPRAFAVDTSKSMLRSDDGSTFVELDPVAQAVQITAPGGITLNGVTIDSSGNVSTAADMVAGGKSLKTHTHSGVQAGGGTSGPPS